MSSVAAKAGRAQHRRAGRRHHSADAIVIGSPPVLEVVDEAHERAIIHELALFLLSRIEAEDRELAARAAAEPRSQGEHA